MGEKEPLYSRYKDSVDYQPTVPGSKDALRIAADVLLTVEEAPPIELYTDPLMFLWFPNEARGLYINFSVGKAMEAHLKLDKNGCTGFAPDGFFVNFTADPTIDRREIIHALREYIESEIEKVKNDSRKH